LRHCARTESSCIARKAGIQVWRQHLDEEVFVIVPFDLEAAFAKATAWNAACQHQPPGWGLLLHVGVAAISGATFMSFNPELRKQAADEGLPILPPVL